MVYFVSSKKNDIIANQFCYLLSNIFIDTFAEQEQQKIISNSSDIKEKSNKHLIVAIIKEEYFDSILAENTIIVRLRGRIPRLCTFNNETWNAMTNTYGCSCMGLWTNLWVITMIW